MQLFGRGRKGKVAKSRKGDTFLVIFAEQRIAGVKIVLPWIKRCKVKKHKEVKIKSLHLKLYKTRLKTKKP